MIDDQSGTPGPRAPMHVLMLGWELPPRISGGLGRVCGELVARLGCREGVHITFVVPDIAGRGEVHYAYKDVDVIEVSLHEQALPSGVQRGRPAPPDAYAYGADIAWSAAYSDACEEVVRKSRVRIDLIHAHDWLTFAAGVRLKELLDVPLVAHVHSTEHDRSAAPGEHICGLEKLGIDRAQSVIAVSSYTRNTIAEKYGCDPAKLEVVYNGATIGGAPVCREGRQDDVPTVAFIGRLTYQKGAEYFVEAATDILESFPATRFVVVGEGEDSKLLHSLVGALQLAEHFSFAGFLDFAGVKKVMETSDAVVMPSLSEPFGLVAIEAASIGIPTVISKNSGVAEILTSAPAIEPRSPAAISRAVIELLSDRKAHAEIGRRVQAEAGKLSWETMADEISLIYRRLVVGQ